MESKKNEIIKNLNLLKSNLEEYKKKICDFSEKNNGFMSTREKKYYSNHFIFSKGENVNLFIKIFLEKMENLDDFENIENIEKYLPLSQKALNILNEAMNSDIVVMKKLECLWNRYKKSSNQENKTEFSFCYSKAQNSCKQNYNRHRAS